MLGHLQAIEVSAEGLIGEIIYRREIIFLLFFVVVDD